MGYRISRKVSTVGQLLSGCNEMYSFHLLLTTSLLRQCLELRYVYFAESSVDGEHGDVYEF